MTFMFRIGVIACYTMLLVGIEVIVFQASDKEPIIKHRSISYGR